jgi:hypothetical protein
MCTLTQLFVVVVFTTIITATTAEGNLALKEAIGQDGNRYYCAKCKTAGEV